MFVDQFTNIMDSLLAETQYVNVVSDYQAWNDDGTNPLRVLVYSIPKKLSLVRLKSIRKEDDPVINFAVGASIIASGFYIISAATSGLFLGRLPIYVSAWSQYILLPWEINHMFTDSLWQINAAEGKNDKQWMLLLDKYSKEQTFERKQVEK